MDIRRTRTAASVRRALPRALRVIAVAAFASSAFFVMPACEQEGPAEEAGEEIDEAAEEAGDAMEEAADEMDN
jgi:hypothetical protein